MAGRSHSGVEGRQFNVLWIGGGSQDDLRGMAETQNHLKMTPAGWSGSLLLLDQQHLVSADLPGCAAGYYLCSLKNHLHSHWSLFMALQLASFPPQEQVQDIPEQTQKQLQKLQSRRHAICCQASFGRA